jgi:hypothetical protein
MKTYHQVLFLTAALSLAAISCPGRTTSDPAATAAPADQPATADAVSALWNDIKNDSYDLRAHFQTGFKSLEVRVDAQIAELDAKRAAMNHNNTDMKAWDFAMKEMGDSRSYLRSMGEETARATRENWEQKREKVGQAWQRAQDAYGKVKASTTT